MQKTENLGLNLFEGSDAVLAESFNENTRLIDQSCTENKELAENNYTLNQQLIEQRYNANKQLIESRYAANKERVETLASNAVTVATGTYTGNDSGAVTLTFDRKPFFVVVCDKQDSLLCFHGLTYGVILNDNFNDCVDHGEMLTWDDSTNSLRIVNTSKRYNYADQTYQYFAFLTD